MKKIFVALSMVAFLAACGDDSSSASAGQNDDLGIESSSSSVTLQSSSSVRSSSSAEPALSSAEGVEDLSSSSEKEKSSSSKNEDSSSSVKSESSYSVTSSYSVEEPKSSSSEPESSSSSSVGSEPVEGSSSSLVIPDGWSWDVLKEARLNPDVTYGTMTDSRDGKVYRTVKIGDQTWMAENLNYADSAKTPSLKGKSWCFGNDSLKCKVTGRFYTWAAAIDSAKLYTDKSIDCGYGKTSTLPDTVYGICPPGWHLPNNTEWNALFTAVGGQSTAGKVLKSQSGWVSHGNGTDAFGFSALPAGFRNNYNGYFYDVGNFAYFWSSTESSSYNAYFIDLNYYNEDGYLNYGDKGYGYSVRCLKD